MAPPVQQNLPVLLAGLGSDPCSTRLPPPQKPLLHPGFWPGERAGLSAETHPYRRGSLQATGLFRKPLSASPCFPTDRARPRPCYHPNLKPRAGAAHFVPTRLAAARPRCLSCRLLVSLVPQGAFGGPLASSLGGLSPRHPWAKAGSPLSSSSSAPAVRPVRAKPAAVAAAPQQECTCPGQQPHGNCGKLPRPPEGCVGGQL